MNDEKGMLETQGNVDFWGDDISSGHPQDAKRTIKRFLKNFLKQKLKITIVAVYLAISALCGVLTPALTGQAINEIFDTIQRSQSLGEAAEAVGATVDGIILTILGSYLLSALFNYVPQCFMASVSQNLTLSLRESISDKLNRLPLRYYDAHKKGNILSRVTGGLERIPDTLQESLTQLISTVITVTGAFAIMVSISPSLTLIALGTIIASTMIVAIISARAHHYYATDQTALGELNANIEEVFTGNNTIKTYHLQQDMINTNDKLNEKLRRASTKAQFVTYTINPLVRLMEQIGYAMIAIRGAMAVIGGSITIGEIQAIFQYVNQISEPITQLSFTMNSLRGAIASLERMYQIQNELEEIPDAVQTKMISQPKDAVTFKQVRFGYRGDHILMKNINIFIEAGSKIVVVGPTGAGKTTLINLLVRFYELQSGKVTIGGVNVIDMSRSELRPTLGMVLQDIQLFNGTIVENIAYGRSDASMGDVKRTVEAARIDHFIRTLPQGYETVLDDRLTGTSVGQKQLLTIARVILVGPSILILDEATPSADARTEVEIQKATNHLVKGRTDFVIARRLFTTRDADLILVMRDGTIVEQGTHEELIQQNGFYVELCQSQFVAKVS